MDLDPFAGLKISSSEFLDDISGRQNCEKCGKSRKYFCYSCCLPLSDTKDKIPLVKLPLKIDILKHPNELDSKSTAVHAALLAVEDVTIHIYPSIPRLDVEKVVLLYPDEKSLALKEYVEKHCTIIARDSNHAMSSAAGSNENTEDIGEQSNQEECPLDVLCLQGKRQIADAPLPLMHKIHKQKDLYNFPFERVIFIDSTWNQVHRIKHDQRLRGLPQIELNAYETKFWRHQQDKPSTCLSTIEAVYYFLCEYHEYFQPSDYQGEYDNLLFFFAFTYRSLNKSSICQKEKQVHGSKKPQQKTSNKKHKKKRRH